MAHELQLTMGLFTVFNSVYLYWNWLRTRTFKDDSPDKLSLAVMAVSLVLGICTLADYMASAQVNQLIQTLQDMTQSSSGMTNAGK